MTHVQLFMRNLRRVAAPGMNLVGWVFAVLWVGSACGPGEVPPTPPPLAAPPQASPKLVPGDVVEVRVFDEEQLSGTFQVQDDGSINFPLLGRVMVAGRAQAELAGTLRDGLARGYLRDPHVSVLVKERKNFEVSVLGQVSQPGSFPWIDRMTLIQAISSAGGLTGTAAGKRIKLTRQTDQGPRTFEVSLPAITKGLSTDLFLVPGDIVFVPEARI
ncbi:MAG: polysaccharide biosynthesis/export family protein [Nannocystaceae bacterium]